MPSALAQPLCKKAPLPFLSEAMTVVCLQISVTVHHLINVFEMNDAVSLIPHSRYFFSERGQLREISSFVPFSFSLSRLFYLVLCPRPGRFFEIHFASLSLFALSALLAVFTSNFQPPGLLTHVQQLTCPYDMSVQPFSICPPIVHETSARPDGCSDVNLSFPFPSFCSICFVPARLLGLIRRYLPFLGPSLSFFLPLNPTSR